MFIDLFYISRYFVSHIIHGAEGRRHFQLSVRLSDECATIFVEICRRYRAPASKHFEGSFQPILFSPEPPYYG